MPAVAAETIPSTAPVTVSFNISLASKLSPATLFVALSSVLTPAFAAPPIAAPIKSAPAPPVAMVMPAVATPVIVFAIKLTAPSCLSEKLSIVSSASS